MKNQSTSDGAQVITLLLLTAALIVGFIFIHHTPPLTSGVLTSENCTRFVCPPSLPVKGDKGDDGKGGPPGRKGDDGNQGTQGIQGKRGGQGEKGDTGMCLASPTCEKGEQGVKGDKGDKGDKGNTGAPGLAGKGEKGDPGGQGKEGKDGPIGPTGNGTQGIQGIPGNCSCFDVNNITLQNINATESFTLSGSFMCEAGSTIDPSCLTTGACPDFSPCDTTFASLAIKGGTNPVSSFTLGVPGTFTDYFLAGDSTVSLPNYMLTSFKTFAETTALDGRTRVDIRATQGSIIIGAGGSIGSIVQIASAGSILHSAVQDYNVDSATFRVICANSIRLITSANVEISGGSVSIKTNEFEVHKVLSGTWIETHIQASLTPGPIVPLTPNLSPSIHLTEDVHMYEGKNLISRATDGFLHVGPYLNVFGDRLTCSGPALSIEKPITNALPGSSLVISNLDGLDVRDTPIYSSTSTMVINNMTTIDNTGVVNADQFIAATSMSAQTITVTALTGVVTINGQQVLNSGSCCASSDLRVKNNVTTVKQHESVGRLLGIRPKTWKYTQSYLDEDIWVRNGTHTGFIAQELKTHYPRAVYVKEKNVGKVTYTDFHTVNKDILRDEIIADLVATVQYLYKEVERLKK